MPKISNVVVWTVAALVTLAIEAVGLRRAIALKNELTREASCPVPSVEALPETPPMPMPPYYSPPPFQSIGVVSVRDDAVEIAVGESHHELPGYPPPISSQHSQGRLTTAVVAPDGQQVAIAGVCYGNSGSDPRVPSCGPVFVRLYHVADGRH